MTNFLPVKLSDDDREKKTNVSIMNPYRSVPVEHADCEDAGAAGSGAADGCLVRLAQELWRVEIPGHSHGDGGCVGSRVARVTQITASDDQLRMR